MLRLRLPLIALALVLSLLPHAAGAELARPNVLLLFADDQRADTIAALGNKHVKTPNLDRVVRRGLSFDRAYMQGGFNGATCVPSRAMLLSGQSLFHVDERLLRDETWPEAFANAGYATFVTGKWHNGAPSLVRCFQEARGIFAGGMTNPLRAPLADVSNGRLGQPHVAKKHACEVFADEAVQFLNQPHERPFFCYVPFDAPHDPHVVPADFSIDYDPSQIPLPANFLPRHPFDNGEMNVRDELLLDTPRDPEQVRAMIAEYYRYVSYLDAQVGRILDALDASPYADKTIVVFAADSGVARGSHGLIGKQNCYEHSLRVPFVIAGPGIPAGKRTNAMCYLFDLLPTLGKLCDVAPPERSEGIEFTRVLANPKQAARTEMVFAYQTVQRAIRDEKWKLIRYPHADQTQLFHLQSDPEEIHDLSADPKYAQKRQEMLMRLEQALQRAGDQLPLTRRPPSSKRADPVR